MHGKGSETHEWIKNMENLHLGWLLCTFRNWDFLRWGKRRSLGRHCRGTQWWYLRPAYSGVRGSYRRGTLQSKHFADCTPQWSLGNLCPNGDSQLLRPCTRARRQNESDAVRSLIAYAWANALQRNCEIGKVNYLVAYISLVISLLCFKCCLKFVTRECEYFETPTFVHWKSS